MLSVAALRLGLCASAAVGAIGDGDFARAGEVWWRHVSGGEIHADEDVLNLANEGLGIRGLGEEIYLPKPKK